MMEGKAKSNALESLLKFLSESEARRASKGPDVSIELERAPGGEEGAEASGEGEGSVGGLPSSAQDGMPEEPGSGGGDLPPEVLEGLKLLLSKVG